MKKLLIVFVILATVCMLFVGCKDTNDEKTEILIVAPDGAPSIAMGKLLSENKQYDKYSIKYEIIAGTTNLQAKAMEADIVFAPTNLASALYNKGENLKIVGSAVDGILYLLGTENLEDLSQLKGKVVYSIGQGNTPEFVFKYILSENEIAYEDGDTAIADKVVIKYETDPMTVMQQAVNGTAAYVILGEPQVTAAMKKVSNLKNLFNLQEEWGGGYPQVSVFMKTSVLDDHKEFAEGIIGDLADINAWTKDNTAALQEALTDAGSSLSGLTSEIIERCNIKFVSSKDAKEDIKDYLNVMMTFKSAFIGGKMPDDGIFYIMNV